MNYVEELLINDILEAYPWDGKVIMSEMPTQLFIRWYLYVFMDNSYDLESSIGFFQEWCDKYVVKPT